MATIAKDVGRAAVLRIELSFAGPADARQTARIIDQAANAFAQTEREIGRRGAQLVIVDVQFGSIITMLQDAADVIGAISTLAEHGDGIRRFVSTLAEAYFVLTQAGTGYVAPAVRSLFEALSAPVKSGAAEHAQVSVAGDNNLVLVFNGATAADIDAALRSPVVQHRLERPIEPGWRDGAGERDPRLPGAKRGGAIRPDIEQMVPLIHGTALWVQHEWYVRPDGFGGLLIPAVQSSATDLMDVGTEYIVEGYVDSIRGRPSSFRIHELPYV